MSLSALCGRLSIRTKSGQIEPLRPNWAQREFLDEVERQRALGQPVRIIGLKARQLGFSTITEALLFNHGFIWPNSFGLVLAHKTDSSEGIFEMTRRYWTLWPFRDLYTAKYHSKRELAWEETGSAIRIATASSGSTGRGRTINFLHGSECAFWDNAEELMTGLRQTIPSDPSSVIILESTANGIGNWFHQTWVDAVDGDNEFTPMFFPWYRHPEYTASATAITMPPIERLDDEESFLAGKLKVDEDHLQWRRWAIPNLCNGSVEFFHQEYPATADEAFITSGSPVFDLAKLKACYEPMSPARGIIVPNPRNGQMEFQRQPHGPLSIYRLPSVDRDWGQYFVAGDPAHAGGQDYACIQVINRRMYEQVAVWHGKIDPVTFGDELVKLARFYNDAEVTTEVEGPGYATIGRLTSLEYPHLWRHRHPDRHQGKIPNIYGWSTNWKRKDWSISELAKLVIDGSILIHDRRTYEEMREYVTLPGPYGGYGPADAKGHDDTVMALAICVVCSRTDGPVGPYEARDAQDAIEPLPEWASWLQDEVNQR